MLGSQLIVLLKLNLGFLRLAPELVVLSANFKGGDHCDKQNQDEDFHLATI